YGDQPQTFVTANVVVAPTAEEAQLRSEPFLLQVSRLRTGGPMEKLHLAGDDVRTVMNDYKRKVSEELSKNWMIGAPKSADGHLGELAGRFDVDEIMIEPVGGGRDGEDPREAPGGVQTIDLLAEELLGADAAAESVGADA